MVAIAAMTRMILSTGVGIGQLLVVPAFRITAAMPACGRGLIRPGAGGVTRAGQGRGLWIADFSQP